MWIFIVWVCLFISVSSISVFIRTQGICNCVYVCVCVWEWDRLSVHLHMLVCSICLIIQETGTHHSVGSWGIRSRSATFVSLKKQTERTYVAVFSILHKIKKDSECAQGKRPPRWMRNPLWRRFKGAILHQLMSKGSEWRDAHCRETARCYTRESVRSKIDQGWNDSKLALKNWVLARKTDEGNI